MVDNGGSSSNGQNGTSNGGKPRMGVLLRQSVAAEKSPNRNDCLESLRERYKQHNTEFKGLKQALKQRHQALVNTGKSRAAMATAMSEMATDSPIEQQAKLNEAKMTKLAQKTEARADEYLTLSVDYVDEWQGVLQTRLNADLKTVDALRRDADHYKTKYDAIQDQVMKLEAKKKTVPAATTEKLQRNKEKLKEADSAYHRAARDLYLVMEELVDKAWRDLHPLVLKLVQFDASLNKDQDKTMRVLEQAIHDLQAMADNPDNHIPDPNHQPEAARLDKLESGAPGKDISSSDPIPLTKLRDYNYDNEPSSSSHPGGGRDYSPDNEPSSSSYGNGNNNNGRYNDYDNEPSHNSEGSHYNPWANDPPASPRSTKNKGKPSWRDRGSNNCNNNDNDSSSHRDADDDFEKKHHGKPPEVEEREPAAYQTKNIPHARTAISPGRRRNSNSNMGGSSNHSSNRPNKNNDYHNRRNSTGSGSSSNGRHNDYDNNNNGSSSNGRHHNNNDDDDYNHSRNSSPSKPDRKKDKSNKSKSAPPKSPPARGSGGRPESNVKRSAGAPVPGAATNGYDDADPSKWKLTEDQFSGGFVYETKGQTDDIKGPIKQGIQTFKDNPEKYLIMFYQTNMLTWPVDQQRYMYIHRKDSKGYKPTGISPKGPMTILMQSYQRLPPLSNNVLPKSERDAYTDDMTHQKKKLHSSSNLPILPGRGMGIGDTPDLKIIGDVDPSDIHQGSVGDCWLLSGISSLAEFDGAVKHLYRKTTKLQQRPLAQPNKYIITLWDLKTWTEVDIVIDERLPVMSDGTGRLLASRPSEDGELWVCYLEKALACHCGGWDKITGGQCTHAWALLTGCKEQYTIRPNGKTGKYACYAKFNPTTKEWAKHANSPHDGDQSMWNVPWPKVGGGGFKDITQEELFQKMCAWDDVNFIVGAGCSEKSGDKGLVDNHAYSVIECHNDVAGTDIDLIKVRNPWGKGEIENGQFDDDGPGWDQYPQIKAELKPVVADDGIFWVTKQEFFVFFSTIYLSASNMTEFVED